jgi:hypothetical protein
MAFLNIILEWMMVFATGFFGHVVAHDFCEVAPMISRKMVETAATWLPASIRDRYLEEWLADLLDQPGAVAKLIWSLGCFRSVLYLRRQSRAEFYRKSAVEFVLSTGESVMIDVPTLAAVRSIGTAYDYLVTCRRWIPRPVVQRVIWLAAKLPSLKWRWVGLPDYDKVLRIMRDTNKGLPRKVAVWHDGVLLKDLTLGSD